MKIPMQTPKPLTFLGVVLYTRCRSDKIGDYMKRWAIAATFRDLENCSRLKVFVVTADSLEKALGAITQELMKHKYHSITLNSEEIKEIE